jgi:hypothetical protein
MDQLWVACQDRVGHTYPVGTEERAMLRGQSLSRYSVTANRESPTGIMVIRRRNLGFAWDGDCLVRHYEH